MQLCNFAHNVLSQKTMFKVSNRNTTKRCLLISKITFKTADWRHLTTSYLPEVTVQNHVLDSFSWVCTSLQSKVCFQFCFHIRRPVISPIVSPFKSFYKKSLPKYLIHENSKYQHFDKFFTNFSQIFQFLTFKGRHFSITKLEILIFCGILHLGMDFWNLSWKRIVSS